MGKHTNNSPIWFNDPNLVSRSDDRNGDTHIFVRDETDPKGHAHYVQSDKDGKTIDVRTGEEVE